MFMQDVCAASAWRARQGSWMRRVRVKGKIRQDQASSLCNWSVCPFRKNFRITPYIYYACRMINYVCALLFLKTIETPEGIEYIH